MDRAILVFSKSADADTVKTRLRSVISDENCVSLAMALLQDTIAKILLIDADRYLYLNGSGALTFSPAIPVQAQSGGDLGDRMLNAFEESLRRYAKVLIIGTDSPFFPPQILEQAFAGLDSHDVVLGPAEDGGYYLIGLKESIPRIFAGIPWGTPTVLKRTLSILQGRSVMLLPGAFDIDEPKDLERFQSELAKSDAAYLQHSREWMKGFQSAT